jgi:hypothetical protein
VKSSDGRYPQTYLGKDLREIIKPLNLTQLEFDLICDRFTNKSLFKKDLDGGILRKTDGTPIKINYDNLD